MDKEERKAGQASDALGVRHWTNDDDQLLAEYRIPEQQAPGAGWRQLTEKDELRWVRLEALRLAVEATDSRETMEHTLQVAKAFHDFIKDGTWARTELKPESHTPPA